MAIINLVSPHTINIHNKFLYLTTLNSSFSEVISYILERQKGGDIF